MKNILVITLCVLLMSLSILSCDTKSEDKDFENKREKIQAANNLKINELKKRYGVQENWDSVENFTYRLQENAIDSSRLILIEATLGDIFKRDSQYFMRVSSYTENPRRKIIGNIEITKKQLHDYGLDTIHETLFDIYIVIKAKKLVAIGPEISSEVQTDTDEDGTSHSVTFSFDIGETFLFLSGVCIDVSLGESIYTFEKQ